MVKGVLIKGTTFFMLLGLFLILIFTNSFSHTQAVITDRLYGGGEVLDNIIIIKIDDKSINEIGRWPWDRDVFAQIILKTKEAKVIGVDLSFFEESKNDTLLNKTLSEMDNVVLAAEISDNYIQKPIFNSESGYVNLMTDNDGVIRNIKIETKEDILPFAFIIYKKAWNKNTNITDSIKKINFVASPGAFQSISVLDLLNNSYDFKNKFVFIGVTAPNLHDVFFVPTSNGVAMAGVEIQAHILQNFILDNFVQKQGNLATILIVFIIGFLGMFVFSKRKVYYALPLIFGIIILYSFLGIYLFQNFNYLIDFFFFYLAIILFTGAGMGLNYLEEKKSRSYLTDAFGKYVSKDLLKEIVDYKYDLNLGGEKRVLTLFFSDIRGFTSISEKLSPEELSLLINNYLTEMTRIILEHKGTVDKFIGDAVMAFWNAPLYEKDHALLACKSAIAQIKALKNFNKSVVKQKLPPLKIGCGLHTGEAIVGNFGSIERFDYTALGDTVNLAARLEGLTKYYGVDIIISGITQLQIKNKLKTRKLDEVKVKGKKKPITIYELCTENNPKFVKQFEKALELYFKSKFKQAQFEFKKALKLKDDLSSKMFIERCKEYMKNPPEKNWDGSFEMKEK